MRNSINIAFIILACFALQLELMGDWQNACSVIGLQVMILVAERCAVNWQFRGTFLPYEA